MKTFNDLAKILAHGGRIIADRKAAAPASERHNDGRSSSGESKRWKALPNEKKEDKDAAECVHYVRGLAALGFPILAMADAEIAAPAPAPAKKAA